MITSRDRVIRTLCHEPVDRAPRDLWTTPAMESRHADEVAEMQRRYPNDLVRAEFRHPRGQRVKGSPLEAGQYTDAWGCTWQVAERGVPGTLVHSPLADLGQAASCLPPLETLDKASFAAVNRGCSTTSRFVLGTSDVRVLERIEWLRGPDAARADLRSPGKPIRDLVALLHDFHCHELSLWASTEVDAVVFTDALGSREGLAVSPQVFRDLVKPLYREYCAILHEKDKFAFFRTDGNIEPIFADLVEIGVDAIHATLFAMNLESLAGRFRNRVTFWGDLDHDRILRPGAPEDVRAAVRRVRSALDYGNGGLIAQCQWSPDVPFRNVTAAMEQWLAPMPMHVQVS